MFNQIRGIDRLLDALEVFKDRHKADNLWYYDWTIVCMKFGEYSMKRAIHDRYNQLKEII